MKVLLIIGGQSPENLVSRNSGNNVYKSMKKHDVRVVGINENGKWYELKTKDFASNNWLDNAPEVTDIFNYLKEFDVAFPLLHGKCGEDGTIQGLLELANIPYVGMRVLSSAVGLDKVYTKLLLDRFNIKQVPYIYLRKKNNKTLLIDKDFDEKDDYLGKINELGYPVFVKASNGGSSIGCYKVNNENELLNKINEASTYDDKILVEKAINARELECAVLEDQDKILSNVGEILPHGGFYNYDSKYTDMESKIVIPANISDEERAYIEKTAIKIFKILDGHGLSRCDFFLDKDTNEIYFNEINTMPGFTNTSMYPMLIRNLKITDEELIDKLLESALKK